MTKRKIPILFYENSDPNLGIECPTCQIWLQDSMDILLHDHTKPKLQGIEYSSFCPDEAVSKFTNPSFAKIGKMGLKNRRIKTFASWGNCDARFFTSLGILTHYCFKQFRGIFMDKLDADVFISHMKDPKISAFGKSILEKRGYKPKGLRIMSTKCKLCRNCQCQIWFASNK